MIELDRGDYGILNTIVSRYIDVYRAMGINVTDNEIQRLQAIRYKVKTNAENKGGNQNE